MKKIYLLAILALGAATAVGQGKLDSRSSALLYQYKTEKRALKSTSVSPKMVTAVVQLTDNDMASLEAKGMEVLRQRGDLAIVRLPMDSVETALESSALRSMQFSRPMHSRLDAAHATTGVDLVKKGTGLDKAYTGQGVVVGCADMGIYPNHITFRKAGTQESRVSRVWTVNDGNTTVYDTPEKIAAFSTDNDKETHGTHVMGIAGGSYYSEEVPFVGVASEADLAMVGLISADDTDILLGVENIIAYAKQENKPVVINLSLGSNDGPHDASTNTGKYLARLGEEALICVAAGNEGEDPIAVIHEFSADNTEMKNLVAESGSMTNKGLYGTVEFWSDNSTSFTLKPVIVNTDDGDIICELEEALAESGSVQKTYSSTADANIAKYLTGSFTVDCGINASNNRYNALADFSGVKMKQESYAIGYVITGSEGTTVRGYADDYGVEFNADVDGWADDISYDGTISSLACGENVIAVGAYTSKTDFKFINGSTQKESGNVGDIAEFSSYGTLVDGRKLPHVCAPGNVIISAYSTPYIKSLTKSPEKYTLVAGRVIEGDNCYFWNAMSGTSMSTPYVTGTVALWLEANPKLTVADVLDIINETSTRDSNVNEGNSVQWGAGKINAYEGLKKILKDSGVGEVNSDKNLLVRDLGANEYEIFVAGERALSVAAYDLSGRKVATAASGSDTVVLNLGGQQKGVYMVSIEGQSSRYTKKIVVRW